MRYYRRKKTNALVTDESVLYEIRIAISSWHSNKTGRYIDITASSPEYIKVNSWRIAITDLMSKAISIVQGTSIPIRWGVGRFIAYTDGAEVVFGINWFLDNFLDPILSNRVSETTSAWNDIRAISYHELSHIIWSPRRSQRPMTDLDSSLQRAMNILEDQRIESLFVARYSPSRSILTNAVLQHCLGVGTNADAVGHLYIWGRKYLPKKIRDAYREMFIQNFPHLEAEATSIIDEYRTLIFPQDAQRAIELITTFDNILSASGANGPMAGTFPGDGDDHRERKNGRPESVGQQRSDQEAREKSDSEFDGEGMEPSDGEAEDGEPGGDAEGPSEPWAQKGGRQSGSPSEGDAEDGESGEGGGESSGSGVSTDPGGGLRDEIKKTLNDIAPELHKSARQTIKSARSIVDDNTRAAVPQVNDNDQSPYEVEPWMRSDAKRISTEIARIFSETDERWIRGQAAGKINFNDVLRSRGASTEVFEAWEDADDDATSFEVFISLDRSSSMDTFTDPSFTNTRMSLAAKTCWVLKRAFQELGIPVTVAGYDSSTPTMVSTAQTDVRNDTCLVPTASGGTRPEIVVPWARSVLRSSEAKNRLLVSITDGEWDWNETIESEMSAVRAEGVQTLLVVIGEDPIRSVRRYVPAVAIDRSGSLYNGHEEVVRVAPSEIRKFATEVGSRIARLAASYVEV